MQAIWQAHLTNYKAHIDDGKVLDFGNAAAEMAAIDNGIIIADLSHFGLISVAGADAQDFLQNQLSNDVRLVTAEQSQLSSYCNPKGRILASFRLFMRQDAYLMEMPRTIVAQTMNRLRMFVLRSQVELNDASEQWLRIGLAGPDCENLLEEHVGQYPEGIDGVCQVDDLTLIRLPGTTARFEILAPAEKIIPLWDKLADKASPVGAAAWSHLDILAGIPVIYPETTDSFVPQMVNLHAINGVSFKKGCYPGQEIVARMQYLGKLKRRMYLAHVATNDPVASGDELFSTTENTQSVGKVVEAAPSTAGGYDLLAVIQIAELEKGQVLLHNKQGSILEIQDLPYSVAE